MCRRALLSYRILPGSGSPDVRLRRARSPRLNLLDSDLLPNQVRQISSQKSDLLHLDLFHSILLHTNLPNVGWLKSRLHQSASSTPDLLSLDRPPQRFVDISFAARRLAPARFA